jgi:hypothetical protein
MREEPDMSPNCCKDTRREAVRRFRGRTGLDYVEVSSDQRTLYAYFLGKLPPEFRGDGPALVDHLRIEGGERITGIRILDVDPKIGDDPELDDWLEIRLDRYGDHAPYALHLVDVADTDPLYASATFSFKVGCPSDLDCAPQAACIETPPPEPAIHYLARDYASFRRLIQDRLAAIAPRWDERHAPDLGVAISEVLAYVGDHLAYYQDAVATEAYLDTARQRISVRRHARLVDYRLHEGCNARAWVAIETDQDIQFAPREIAFLAGIDPQLPLPTVLGPRAFASVAPVDLSRLQHETFEPRGGDTLRWYAAHSRIEFYDWGRDDCCLPRGATSVTLRDAWVGDGDARALQLQPGDVLIFREVRGARTGLEADADPERCWAVRLTGVHRGEDSLFPLLPAPSHHDEEAPSTPEIDAKTAAASASQRAYRQQRAQEPPTPRSTPLLHVEWDAADALPFPLCLSALGPAPDCARIRGISIAHGNVVEVDHGRRQDDVPLGTVPADGGTSECLCEGQPGQIEPQPAKIRWRLAHAPLTHREPPPPSPPPASRSLEQDPRRALPALRLRDSSGGLWTPVPDLLDSGADDRHVVVETDNDGIAHLRFGDGELGRRPDPGATFTADYRIGSGLAGNVGPGAINRLRLLDRELDGLGLRVFNPMAARGGRDPESLAEARMYAPGAYRRERLRAVTADDYAEFAQRDPRVQRAACELVWTGSWYEADVALDPLGRVPATEPLLGEVETALHAVRRMGHDLHVEPARYVAIDLGLEVCALPGYERGAVKAALLERFGRRRMRDGSLGYFHPDRLSFGEPLRMSAIVAEAMAVPGVECVRVTRLQRTFLPPNRELEDGLLALARYEIARLDNDPNHPEHGSFAIEVRGGR